MPKFYFTYGTSESYPFKGGWTEVEAPDMRTAIAVFRLAHPDKAENTINCAFYYTEEEFYADDSFVNGNRGHGVWERLKLTQEVFE